MMHMRRKRRNARRQRRYYLRKVRDASVLIRSLDLSFVFLYRCIKVLIFILHCWHVRSYPKSASSAAMLSNTFLFLVCPSSWLWVLSLAQTVRRALVASLLHAIFASTRTRCLLIAERISARLIIRDLFS